MVTPQEWTNYSGGTYSVSVPARSDSEAVIPNPLPSEEEQSPRAAAPAHEPNSR